MASPFWLLAVYFVFGAALGCICAGTMREYPAKRRLGTVIYLTFLWPVAAVGKLLPAPAPSPRARRPRASRRTD